MEERIKKHAEELTGVIIKRAEELADEVTENLSQNTELQTKVDDVLTKMSEEDLEKYAEDIAYARGIAYGEAMAKAAAMDEAMDIAYTLVMEKIAEVLGEEKAKEVDTKLREGEPPLGEIAEVATEAAAKKLIEQAGGDKAVENNPEMAKEIVETAVAIGKQVASEVAAESAPTE